MKDKIEKLIDSIKQIDDDDSSRSKVIYEHQFPDLTTAIENLVREEAEGFAEWFSENVIRGNGNWRFYLHNDPQMETDEGVITRFAEKFCKAYTTSELFTLYQNSKNKSDAYPTTN